MKEDLDKRFDKVQYHSNALAIGVAMALKGMRLSIEDSIAVVILGLCETLHAINVSIGGDNKEFSEIVITGVKRFFEECEEKQQTETITEEN